MPKASLKETLKPLDGHPSAKNYETLSDSTASLSNEKPASTSGESAKKRSLYRDSSGNPSSPCSKTQALCITVVVLLLLVTVAIIAAFARPFSRCSVLSKEGENGFGDASLGKAIHPTSTTGEPFPWTDIRLPAFIVPIHYDIFMHPNLTTFLNHGSVNITFKLTEEVDFVVLHVKEMQLTELRLFSEQGEDVPVKNHLEYSVNEQLYVQFEKILTKHKPYVLHIAFRKQLEEKLEGFYLSSYLTSDRRKRYLATTHFEPTSARSAFPCFDEPAMKATFQLAMVHDKMNKAYFNSREKQTLPYDDNLLITEFEPTLKMSTYLVAFIVCDFLTKKFQTKEGVEVRVIVPAEQLIQSEFALDTAVKILSHFHSFFNISYPMPKLDLVAVPDFGPGAMENWGLITFRMTTILYDKSESSNEAREHVAIVISHELAHQWFGNLVTMQWWSDLWLNEGFASFVEHLGVDYIYPEWKMMDHFIVSTTQDALRLDSLESSHPIMAAVENPVEIEGIFDAISYKKGAAIIRMLEDFLGLDSLRKGLSHYLHKYQFQNANTQNLWDAFTEVSSSKVNVSSVMETWTKQKNYPLVTVKSEGRTIHLRQRRFVLTPPEDDEAEQQDISPYGYKWVIPVTFTTDKTVTVNQLWMNFTDVTLKLEQDIEWIKLNVNQTGFYRVMYDDKIWRALIQVMQQNHEKFSPPDRASLLDDAMTLARVGILDSHTAMNLSLYLQNEEDYVPWETGIVHLDTLDYLLEETPGYLLLQKYIVRLLSPLREKLGMKDTGRHLIRKLRSLILGTLMHHGDNVTIQEALKMFHNYMDRNIKVAPNLRSVVYDAGIRFGSAREWEFCWRKYQETNIPSEKRLLLAALGRTRDMWQLSQFLNYSLDKTKIRPQDTILVISVAARNPIGRLLTWRFVRSNWDHILEKFGQGSFSMDTIISDVASHFSTRFDYEEVKRFFESVEVGSGAHAVNQSLERIRANIHWRENVEASVIDWLRKQMGRN